MSEEKKEAPKQTEKQEEQEKVFEWWYLTILKANPQFLKKNGPGLYCEESVGLMFLGFCSGWDAITVKESLEFKRSIMH